MASIILKMNHQAGELNRKGWVHASVIGQMSSFPSPWALLSARSTPLSSFSGSQGLGKAQGAGRDTAGSRHFRNLVRFTLESVRDDSIPEATVAEQIYYPLVLHGFWMIWERERRKEGASAVG